jgi:hypothetical protein
MGEQGSLEQLGLEALAQLEAQLEEALRSVRSARERRLKEALGDEQSRVLCSVCLSKQKTILFLPCKHLCACSDCAARIMRPLRLAQAAGGGGGGAAAEAAARPACPICRATVEQVLDVFS